MPKSIDKQIEDAKFHIEKYKKKLDDLENRKLNILIKANNLNIKEVKSLIKKGKSIEEIQAHFSLSIEKPPTV